MHIHQDFACLRCFNDKRLREFIKKENWRSWCSWCGARNTYVIPLSELSSAFREVARIYEPAEGPNAWELGDHISTLLQEDWQVFSEKVVTDSNDLMQRMTIAILEADLDPKDDVDKPDYHGLFWRRIEGLETEWHERVENLLLATLKRQSQVHTIDEHSASYSDKMIKFAIEALSLDLPRARFFLAPAFTMIALEKNTFNFTNFVSLPQRIRLRVEQIDEENLYFT